LRAGRFALVGYGFAFAGVAVTAVLHASGVLSAESALLTFILPVMLAAFAGGIGPGLAATGGAVVVSVGTSLFGDAGDGPGSRSAALGIFIVAGVLVSWLAAAARRASFSPAPTSRYDGVEEALRRSEERYRAIVDTQSEMVCRFRLDGQILFANGRAAESVPYHRRSLEYAPGQPLLQVNLARALIAAEGREGTDEALALLRQVTSAEPENAFAWRTIAEARYARGEEALAELASAERCYSIGDYQNALHFAERARRSLPRNTVDYQRATDIVTFAGNEVRDQMRERERRG